MDPCFLSHSWRSNNRKCTLRICMAARDSSALKSNASSNTSYGFFFWRDVFESIFSLFPFSKQYYYCIPHRVDMLWWKWWRENDICRDPELMNEIDSAIPEIDISLKFLEGKREKENVDINISYWICDSQTSFVNIWDTLLFVKTVYM